MTIEVVSAAITRRFPGGSKRLLLAQRGSYSGATSHALKFCTPGGKKTLGETHRQALLRELGEEIGLFSAIAVSEARVLSAYKGLSTTTPSDFSLVCYTFEAPEEFVPRPNEAEKIIGIGWFGAEEIAMLPLAPADDCMRADLISLVA